MLSGDECASVIKFTATFDNKDFKSKHINFLMVKNEIPGSGVVQTLSCDLSSFSWKKIIKRYHLEYDAMKVIVAQGGSLTSHDIQFIITECEENVSMLELAIGNCTPKPSQGDMKKYSEQALKHKKFRFVMVLISHGAEVSVARIVQGMCKSDILSNERIVSYLKSTPEGCTKLFFKAMKYSEYVFADILLSSIESESVTRKISLSSVLECQFQAYSEARKEYISFVKRLLENGIDPNGDGDANSLDIVLNFSKEYPTEKIELLTLLLQHGAAIEQCTYQRKNETTLLHIATRFAIDSGMPLVFIHCSLGQFHIPI